MAVLFFSYVSDDFVHLLCPSSYEQQPNFWDASVCVYHFSCEITFFDKAVYCFYKDGNYTVDFVNLTCGVRFRDVQYVRVSIWVFLKTVYLTKEQNVTDLHRLF